MALDGPYSKWCKALDGWESLGSAAGYSVYWLPTQATEVVGGFPRATPHRAETAPVQS